MMKQRSSLELSPSDYFFAVYPISIQFQRQYKTPFHLYFQKNLQIISRHQCLSESFEKDQIVHFVQPQQVHHFRVQSQKNLQYSWSLYTSRMGKEIENEQFIEGKKITLKQQWAIFKSKKQSFFQQSIKFNTINCKLNYAVMIGKNNQQVLDLTPKKAEQRASVITNEEKILLVTQQFNQEQAKVQEQKVQSNKNIQPYAEPIQNIVKEQQIGTSPEKANIEESKSIEAIKVYEIVQNDQDASKLKLSPQSKQSKQILSLMIPTEEETNGLTISQIKIGKQIQEIIISKESIPNEQNIENVQQKPKTSEQAQEGKVKLTNSQLINEKKQVVTPVITKLVLAFVLLVILIFSGGYWKLSKSVGSPVVIQNIKEKGKKQKAREQTKEVPTRKGKVKK